MENMLKLIILSIVAATFAFTAEDAPKLSKESQAIIDKALDANLAAPSKAYDAYQKALSDASGKTLKDLEKIKADANDTRKGSMSLIFLPTSLTGCFRFAHYGIKLYLSLCHPMG